MKYVLLWGAVIFLIAWGALTAGCILHAMVDSQRARYFTECRAAGLSQTTCQFRWDFE